MVKTVLVELTRNYKEFYFPFNKIGSREQIYCFLTDYEKRIQDNTMLGELIYPDKFTKSFVSLTDVSHLILEAKCCRNEVFFIKIKILDTPQGRILKNFIKFGGGSLLNLKPRFKPISNRIITFDFCPIF